MDRLIYHNDVIVDSAEVRLAPTIAGVVYGWGVFTNLRIDDFKPLGQTDSSRRKGSCCGSYSKGSRRAGARGVDQG